MKIWYIFGIFLD